jgi:quercetin dioxygenase-like cupin family protein
MDTNDLVKNLMEGKVVCLGRDTCSGDVEWSPHPRFEGVRMKHLVKGADTGGKFSSHIVHIAEGKEICDHTHASQYEYIQILSGTGTARLGDKVIPCTPGVNMVAPDNVDHCLKPEGGDIYLLATFVPALL